MPTYRIFRLSAEHAARFREKAPGAGKVRLRRGRYAESGAIEADSPYDAWKLLQADEQGALSIGDVLQLDEEPPAAVRLLGVRQCGVGRAGGRLGRAAGRGSRPNNRRSRRRRLTGRSR